MLLILRFGFRRADKLKCSRENHANGPQTLGVVSRAAGIKTRPQPGSTREHHEDAGHLTHRPPHAPTTARKADMCPWLRLRWAWGRARVGS